MPAISYSKAIRENAEADPDRPSITDATGTLTRGEVDRLTDRVGRQLLDEGVTHGSSVALSGGNSARLLILILGIWRVGAVPVPIHSRKDREDIEALLVNLDPALVVGFDRAIECEAKKLSVDELFLGDDVEAEPLPTEALSPHARIGVSGGSTGRSKLVVVEAPALISRERPWHYGMEANGTHVVALEIVDGTGFVSATAGLALGCHLVVQTAFDPEELLRLIETHQADWLALTPPLMLQVWKLEEACRARYDLSSLRVVTHYSGAVSIWLKRAWIDWLGPERIVESYGASDARGFTWIDGAQWLKHPGSVGLPGRGCELAILDEDHKPVAPGTPGDIYIRDLTGRRNFHYIGAQVETLADGWETVGDFGWLDDEGFLYIGDRRKDLIQGAKGLLFPSQIESAIERHPAVRSAIVIGLPVEGAEAGSGSRSAEHVHAIVDAPYARIDAAEIEGFLESALPPDQCPDSVEFVDEPLRDYAGKARRQQLRSARSPETVPRTRKGEGA